ncbi:MAG TPA: AMP-dependent synthetase/ligase [Steroidobacteraceae bacterium]|nr:AMP-dependent synthetase/ligase [Steroidobacteraceae bacterium]HQR47691.1 AMP-dependent synthetase/ligase [Steroidobacteraceae bacterium]
MRIVDVGGHADALESRTLCEAFQATAAERPGQVAHRTLDGSVEFTYAEFAERVRALATGLHSLGVRRGDTVALMLRNRPEFALADAAAMHVGATAFSVYNTLSPEQIGHLFRNARNRVVVTELMLLPRVLAARTADVEHIVLVDGEAEGAMTLADLGRRSSPGFRFEDAWREVEPGDVLTLIYTSGTTGPPKAVQLTHANVMFEARAIATAMPWDRGGRGISYLPSAHVGDRTLVHYVSSMCLGRTITSIDDYRRIGEALVSVRPTIFGGVPRVWEKIKAALEVAGVRAPGQLPEPVKAAVRERVGLDQAAWSVSSAAPASPEVLRYFNDLGIVLCEGWGMSELSCLATMNPLDDLRPGTVGRALPGVELKLLDDGELLVRAPLVMKGYRDDPEKTAEAIDPQGWLHTGDVAQIDGDGYVTIVDRKKEIIINSAGKNMSPANIEFRLRAASPLIAQAVCIGDRRPYNVALLVLDPEPAARWAADRGLPAGLDALCHRPELRAALDAAVAAANEGLSRVEQVKRYAVIGSEWLPGGDELTPTSKLKRKPIGEKYSAEIERLYA